MKPNSGHTSISAHWPERASEDSRMSAWILLYDVDSWVCLDLFLSTLTSLWEQKCRARVPEMLKNIIQICVKYKWRLIIYSIFPEKISIFLYIRVTFCSLNSDCRFYGKNITYYIHNVIINTYKMHYSIDPIDIISWHIGMIFE